MPRRKPKLRKRRSDFEGRTRIVTVKLTEAEYAAIAEAVEGANAAIGDDEEPATVSSWLRDHALARLAVRVR